MMRTKVMPTHLLQLQEDLQVMNLTQHQTHRTALTITHQGSLHRALKGQERRDRWEDARLCRLIATETNLLQSTAHALELETSITKHPLRKITTMATMRHLRNRTVLVHQLPRLHTSTSALNHRLHLQQILTCTTNTDTITGNTTITIIKLTLQVSMTGVTHRKIDHPLKIWMMTATDNSRVIVHTLPICLCCQKTHPIIHLLLRRPRLRQRLPLPSC
mmetsp:Transcript_12166/g.23718  ORF Transcript_12166/g.23718 Transcript_12166/m.23718 type:complete len:218 (-) Transcript_12166:1601-2254(-)